MPCRPIASRVERDPRGWQRCERLNMIWERVT